MAGLQDQFSSRGKEASYGTSSGPAGGTNGASLQQQFEERGESTARLPKWQTGGQYDSQANAWNTQFYEVMNRQIDEMRSGKQPNLYERTDYTGVVTQNIGNKKAGEIWNNGTRESTVWDQFGEAQGNQIMAQMLWDRQTQAKNFEKANGDDRVLRQMIDEDISSRDREYKGWLSQSDYQESVAAEAKELQGEGRQTANTWGAALAGAGTGALTGGMVGGPVGAGVGGLIGGVAAGLGAWLNQDEILTNQARTNVKQEMTRGDEEGSEVSAWLGGAGTFLNQMIATPSNLLKGGYELSQGGVGNLRSEYYDVDDEGKRIASGWWQALGAGAMFADGALMMTNGLSAGIYTASMAANIASGVGDLTIGGGYVFDDRTGMYDNVYLNKDGSFSTKTTGAAVWNVAIDGLQMGLFRGLHAKGIKDGAAAAKGEVPDVIGGWKFSKNAAGELGKPKIPIKTLLVPSEMTTAIGTRGLAMRYAAKNNSHTISADDMYRAAQSLKGSGNLMRNAMVNAMGEGAEEAAQAILEPISHDWGFPDGQAVLDAALSGYLMGAGFTVGTRMRSSSTNNKHTDWINDQEGVTRVLLDQLMPRKASSDEMQVALIRELEANNGVPEEDRLTVEQLKKMSDKQRAEIKVSVDQLGPILQSAREDYTNSQKMVNVQNIPMIQATTVALQNIVNQATKRLNPRLDSAYLITGSSPLVSEGHMAEMSIRGIHTAYKNAHDGYVFKQEQITKELEAATDPERRAEIQARLDKATAETVAAAAILRKVSIELNKWDSREKGSAGADDRRKIADNLNHVLSQFWEGRKTWAAELGTTPQALRRAAALILLRDPKNMAGSDIAQLPQVNLHYSAAETGDRNLEGNNGLAVSQDILSSIGGDHDGDKMRTQALMEWSEEAFNQARAGGQFLGRSAGPNQRKRESEAVIARLIWQGNLEAADSAYRRLTEKYLDELSDELRYRLSTVNMPGRVKTDDTIVNESIRDFIQDLRAGNEASVDNFLTALHDGLPNVFTVLLNTGDTSFVSLSSFIHRSLQEFQHEYATLTTRLEPSVAQKRPPKGDDGMMIEQEGSVRSFRARLAATAAQTMALVVQGIDMFRMRQSAHYSRERTLTVRGTYAQFAEQWSEEALLIQQFNEQGYGRTDAEELLTRGLLEADALKMIRAVDADVRGSIDKREASLSYTANTYVTYVWAEKKHSDDTYDFKVRRMTVAQMALAQSLAEEQAAISNVTPEYEQRWKAIQQLLQPGSEAKAFERVMGGLTGMELGGSALSLLYPNLTFNQIVHELARLPYEARAASLAILRAQPEYRASVRRDKTSFKGVEIDELDKHTNYRVLVDAIANRSNALMSMARNEFIVGGEMGDIAPKEGEKGVVGKSAKFRIEFTKGWTTLRGFVTQAGFGKDAMSDMAANITRLESWMNSEPAVYEMVKNMARLIGDKELVASLGLTVDKETGTETRSLPIWLYKMLLAPNEQVAEKILWTARLNTRVHLQGRPEFGPSKEIDDRFVQLLANLRNRNDSGMMLALAEQKLQDPNVSVVETMMWLNQYVKQPSEAPFIGWVSSKQDFDVNIGGIATVSDSTDANTLSDFVAAADRARTAYAAEESWNEADSVLIAMMDNDKSHPLRAKLQEALDFGASFGVLISPSDTTAAIASVSGDNQVGGYAKGAPTNPTLTAEANAALKPDSAPGFNVDAEKQLGALTTVGINDVLFNYRAMADGQYRAMDASGRPINTDKLTVDQFIQLYKNPKYRPLLRARIAMIVDELNPNGGVTSKIFAESGSLESLLMADPLKASLNATPEGDAAFLALAGRVLSDAGQQFTLEKIGVTHTISRTNASEKYLTAAEIGNLAETTTRDVVRTLRALAVARASEYNYKTGKFAPNRLLAAVRWKVYGLVEDFEVIEADKELFPDPVARDAETALLRKAAIEARENKMKEDLLPLAENAKASARVREQAERDIAIIAQAYREPKFEKARRDYYLDKEALKPENWEGSIGTAKRANIRTFMDTDGNREKLIALSNKQEELSLILASIKKSKSAGQVPWTLPNESDWQFLSTAIMTSVIQDEIGPRAHTKGVPEYPEAVDRQKMIDPTQLYLLDALLDPDVVDTLAREIVVKAKAGRTPEDYDSDKLAKLAYRNLFEGKLGDWGPELELQIADGVGSFAGSPVEKATQAMGNLSKRWGPIIQSSGYTYGTPVPGTESSMSLAFSELQASDSMIPVTIPVQQEDGTFVGLDIEMPSYQFNGRSIQDVKVTYEGAPVVDSGFDLTTGYPIEIARLDDWQTSKPLVSHQGSDEALASAWKHSSTARLQKSIEARILADRPDLSAEDIAWDQVNISFKMLHPDATPTDLLDKQNAYYMGAPTDVVSFKTNSLIGDYMFVHQGLNPMLMDLSLKSLKSHKAAISYGKTVTRAEVERLEADWHSNLSAVLMSKANVMLAQPNGTGEPNSPNDFNALYQMLLLSHFVRAVDENGKAVLFPAQQWIRMQQLGTTDKFTDADLYMPDQQTLRTMYGDKTAQAAGMHNWLNYSVDPAATLINDPSNTDAMVQNMPHILDRVNGMWVTTTMFDDASVLARGVSTVSKFELKLKRSQIDRNRVRLDAYRALQDTGIRRRATKPEIEKILGGFSIDRAKEVQGIVSGMLKNGRISIGGRAVIGPDLTYATEVMKQKVSDLMKDLKGDAPRAMWELAPPRARGTIRDGILTPESRGLKGDDGLEVYPRDAVVINLDKWLEDNSGNESKTAEKLYNELRLYTARGAEILLVGTRGTRDLQVDLGRELAGSLGYADELGTSMYFKPDFELKKTQNERAYDSMLGAYRPVTANDRYLVATMPVLDLHEGAAYVNPGAMDQQFGLTVEHIPTDYLADFNQPGPGSQRLATVRQVTALYDNPGFFAKLSGTKQGTKEFKEAYAALGNLVRHWAAVGDEGLYDNFLPVEGGTGEFIPFFNERAGQVVLYRVGYDLPEMKELEKQFSQSSVGRSKNPFNVGVSSTKKTNGHTTYKGKRINTRHGARGVLEARMVPINEVLAKVEQQGGGVKTVTTVAPKEWRGLFELPWFDGHPLALLMDNATFDSKGGNYKINNFQRGIAVFGMNSLIDDVAKTLLGVDPAAMEARGESDQALVNRNLARQKLKEFHETVGGKLSNTDAAIWLDQMLETPEQLLRSIVSEAEAFNIAIDDNTTLADQLNKASSPQLDTSTLNTLVILTYMTTKHADVSAALGSGSLLHPDSKTSGGQSREMPEIITRAFDRYTGQNRVDMFDRLRERIPDNLRTKAGSPGIYLQDDWTFRATTTDGKTFLIGLNFPQLYFAGDSSTFDEMANLRQEGSRQTMSVHTADVNMGTSGQRSTYDRQREKELLALIESRPNMSDPKTFGRDLERLRALNEGTNYTPAELAEFRRNSELLNTCFYPGFSFEKGADGVAEYRAESLEILRKLGLSTESDLKGAPYLQVFVDRLVRAYRMAPFDPASGDDFVSPHQAADTARSILENIKKGLMPLSNSGQVPLLTRYDLALIFHANKNNPTWAPRVGNAVKGALANTWEEWVEASFDAALGSKVSPLARAAIDASANTYYFAGDLPVGHPVSLDMLRNAELIVGENPAVSLDSFRRMELAEVGGGDFGVVSVRDLLDLPRNPKDSEHTVEKERKAQQASWAKSAKTNVAEEITLRDQNTGFRRWKQEKTVESNLLRILAYSQLTTTLLNPQLWMSALMLETPINLMRENTATLLGGGSLGLISRTIRLAQEKMIASEKDADRKQMFERLFAGSRFTYRTMELFDEAVSRSGGQHDRDFRMMAWGEAMFQNEVRPGDGRLMKLFGGAANFAGRVQDPMWAVRPKTVYKAYLTGALNAAIEMGDAAGYSTELILEKFNRDATWIQKNIPIAHETGMAKMMTIRSMKQTLPSMLLRKGMEPLTNSSHALVKYPANILLSIPLRFSTFGLNVATALTGTQALSTGGAMLLHGRRTPNSWMREKLGLKQKRSDRDQYFDMTEVLDTVDLAHAIMQSQVSLSGLFGAALIAGGLGLSGEDEETKRRRRQLELQGMGMIYDPRRIENDFRNADAVFFDWLPFGLDALFRVTPDSAVGGSRSMANLHWMLKQFVSPVLGMERFFETGDIRHVAWGFEDAILSFPLINQSTFQDSTAVAAELMTLMADAESLGTEESLPMAYSLAMRIAMTYEQMLFESSFINQIYVMMDELDRDPYKIPLVDQGSLSRDRMGEAQPTTAMTEFVDPDTGEVRKGYETRSGVDASIHAFAEKRFSLAMVMSLVTGQEWIDSSYNRTAMVPKIRKIELPEMEQEILEGMVLSMWDEKTDTEVLTEDGARAVFRSLYKGAIDFDSPALHGVYISHEMRTAIGDKWKEEILQEGLALGLNEYEAATRLYDIWNGNGNPFAVTLQEILWSDKIPYNKVVEYNQLNTTYIKGPDGYMWATGVGRDTLASVLGLPVPKQYMKNEKMSVDGRLNNTDDVYNLNTGMRGLVRRDESWEVPTAEQIEAEQTKALEDAINDNFTKLFQQNQQGGYGNGWSNYGRGGWRNYGRRGYGSGSGYTSFTRTNTPPRVSTPYANDIRSDGLQNVNIRRANIRRERFQSQRGRLKEWQ